MVKYEIAGFLEKNKNTVASTMGAVMRSSGHPIARAMSRPGPSGGGPPESRAGLQSAGSSKGGRPGARRFSIRRTKSKSVKVAADGMLRVTVRGGANGKGKKKRPGCGIFDIV